MNIITAIPTVGDTLTIQVEGVAVTGKVVKVTALLDGQVAIELEVDE